MKASCKMESRQVPLIGAKALANLEKKDVSVLQCVCSDRKGRLRCLLLKKGYLGVFSPRHLGRKEVGRVFRAFLATALLHAEPKVTQDNQRH